MSDLTDRTTSRRCAMAAGAAVVAVMLSGCGGSKAHNAAPTSTVPGSTAAQPSSTSADPASTSATPPGRRAGSAHPSVTAAPVESNPPGDIPDNVAYVSYTNPAGHYRFVHPEGWVSTPQGASVRFTDKLNGIAAAPLAGTSAPTPTSARATDLPRLRQQQPAFELRSMKAVTLPGGAGVLIVYRRNSAPDPVTGRVYRDEVQRYEIVGPGHGISLELYGAVGSDNVDPYTKISQSVRLQ